MGILILTTTTMTCKTDDATWRCPYGGHTTYRQHKAINGRRHCWLNIRICLCDLAYTNMQLSHPGGLNMCVAVILFTTREMDITTKRHTAKQISEHHTSGIVSSTGKRQKKSPMWHRTIGKCWPATLICHQPSRIRTANFGGFRERIQQTQGHNLELAMSYGTSSCG
jgi:hypothetical protein